MVKNNITIENARIMFRNFAGDKQKNRGYNEDRKFSVVLDPDLAKRAGEDGWPVRVLPARNEEDDDLYIMDVKVQFGKFPPQIVLITSAGKMELDEKNVNILDYVNIENVDLQIRPYNYDINEKTGVKAYLKSLWITKREDAFEEKYKDIPYIGDDEEELPFN